MQYYMFDKVSPHSKSCIEVLSCGGG